MQFVITGIHQRNTPVELRERLAFDTTTLRDALAALWERIPEACILSTCNRVEISTLLPDDADPASIGQFLAEWHAIDAEVLAPCVETRVGQDAVRHLFRLAAGLDSMVLGEEQIMSQLRGAVQAATEADTLGPNLRRLFDTALTVGKLVRTKTGISRLNVSVVSVAIDLARQTAGTLAGQRVLIIGAGRMAELALKHLHGVAGAVTIINRTEQRSRQLAERYNVHYAPYNQLETLLATSDIVLSCTSAPGQILSTTQIASATEEREQPLALLDLAVPRDIDPMAALVHHVVLFDVDGMQSICETNRQSRAAEVLQAEQLIELEISKFMSWWASQKVVPTIRALREHAEEIRASELERTLARLPNLGPAEQAAISALSAAIINKLLHTPIAALKNPHEADELADAVQRLFHL